MATRFVKVYVNIFLKSKEIAVKNLFRAFFFRAFSPQVSFLISLFWRMLPNYFHSFENSGRSSILEVKMMRMIQKLLIF